jgi:hypothetical protein
MYCTVKKLDTLFNEARNEHPIETLINAADDNSISENKWSFDKNTLIIYNNNIGKDFFPQIRISMLFDILVDFGSAFTRKME